ncbi:MAG: hypothetical protein GY715_14725 [Planctomycetes bacterium]|nr:hypothetical protein [Planctomycetota bacterium]
MAKCAFCGTTILFGGTGDGHYRFCNQECHQRGYLLSVADQLPDDMMAEHVDEVHQGSCPKCGGPGPIDVHLSYTVWSALVLTTWRTRPEVCCRSCGVKAKLGATVSSGVLGWWGFPWGLVATPVQVGRNVIGMFSPPDPDHPSPQLVSMVKMNLAAHLAAADAQEQAAAAEAAAPE